MYSIAHIKYFSTILIVVFVIIACQVNNLGAQSPKKPSSGEIYQQLQKLGFLGSVLYVAAHPDDENTRLISYLANEKKAHTTYLSLTRGDGGQNLIGSEISELLGVLRTQELLMARSIDNGRQMFTRANDFGYSKNAEETIKIWDTDKIKADVVWAIRNTRPDVVINRFDHRTSGETHGHHTASARLSYEMFEKAADPAVYPEQLSWVQPWQPKRLFFNTSWWFYGSEEKFKKADKSALMSIDVGVYYPLLGKSNTEIAAESRSKHKCQGFGSTGTRGLTLDYLELLKGDMPPSKADIFEGINTSWTRVVNGDKVQPLVEQAIQEYNFREPAASIPLLLKIYAAVQNIQDPFWKETKSTEVKEIIASCAGLYMEAKTNIHKACPGEDITLDFEVISQLADNAGVFQVKTIGLAYDTMPGQMLSLNEPLKWSRQLRIPENASLTAPYWLTKEGTLGMYHVDDQTLIGLPQTPRKLKAFFTIRFGASILTFERDIVHKFNSPENGETYRPLEIVPPASVAIKDPVYVFADNKAKDVVVTVHSWKANQNGKLTLPLPGDWKCTPNSHQFSHTLKGESQEFVFSVTPPSHGDQVSITPEVLTGEKAYTSRIINIDYSHIPFQTVLMKSTARLSRLDIQNRAKKIGYVMGAGDEIPSALNQIGCEVDLIKIDDIQLQKLKQYDAVIMGVRAYNTEENIKFKQNALLEYVKEGGTMLVQYNTSNGVVGKNLGPYPLTVSRGRVTVEEAEMRILQPQHPVFQTPNQITSKDFEGWVQERGLYFPSEWDPAYTPLLSCNDPGEKPLEGSLLIAGYGKGHYIYTGISFFRQLPEGVSGAYRLFANLISLGKTKQKG